MTQLLALIAQNDAIATLLQIKPLMRTSGLS